MGKDSKTSNDPLLGKASAINWFFIFFIASSVLWAGAAGKMEEITSASFDSAKAAVNLSIGLIGIMALWLGLVRILEAGGFMRTIAKIVRPVMIRLFPEVPGEHPAMSAMVLNISANMLGLGNAATPFGIKAMIELKRLNPFSGTASNAMCLFLAINTSSVTLLPLGAIGIRAAAGCANPAAIFWPTLISTLCSTTVGVLACLFFSKFSKQPIETETNTESAIPGVESEDRKQIEETDYSHLLCRSGLMNRALAWLVFAGFVFITFRMGFATKSATVFFKEEFISHWLMPGLMLMMVCYGLGRGVKVYEAVTEGAKQGFDVAVRIIPFLVAILVAIGMFSESGAMDILAGWVTPFTSIIGLPADAIPMALIRPLSGSGAIGVMTALVQQAPDSYTAYVASSIMGSTETTFYVLAVYFGAVGITNIRYALVAALLADFTGVVTACLAAKVFYVPV